MKLRRGERIVKNNFCIDIGVMLHIDINVLAQKSFYQNEKGYKN